MGFKCDEPQKAEQAVGPGLSTTFYHVLSCFLHTNNGLDYGQGFGLFACYLYK